LDDNYINRPVVVGYIINHNKVSVEGIYKGIDKGSVVILDQDSDRPQEIRIPMTSLLAIIPRPSVSERRDHKA
jgi:hypothetical protein